MLIQLQGNPAWCYTGGKQFKPELPTLVFIHGAQNDHSVWGLQSRYFAHHGYNVMAIDLPGHGRSNGQALTSIGALAQWLIAVLDNVGVSKVSLVGHSMGSLIALETARCIPERITKLALLGSAFPMKVADTLLATARDNEYAAIDMVVKWSHCHMMQKTVNPGFNLQGNAMRLMQRMSRLNPAQLFFTDFSACNNYQQGLEAAAIISQHRCPTLFITGQQDRMTPMKASLPLRTAISDAKAVEIAQCGHSLMSEQPDAVLAALIDFFNVEAKPAPL